MIGASGTYAFDNVDLTLQPSEGQWQPRKSLGVDGAGHEIYPAVREFQLSFDLMSTSDLQQLTDAYNKVSSTGTVSVDLPKYGDANYIFARYSGTTLQEPQIGSYFEQYVQSVTLLILNIRTN